MEINERVKIILKNDDILLGEMSSSFYNVSNDCSEFYIFRNCEFYEYTKEKYATGALIPLVYDIETLTLKILILEGNLQHITLKINNKYTIEYWFEKGKRIKNKFHQHNSWDKKKCILHSRRDCIKSKLPPIEE